MKNESKNAATLRRLPRYYRVLRTMLQEGIYRCSSEEIASRTDYSASAVRADLSLFPDCAKQGYGYQLSKLYPAIGEYLGVNDRFCAVLCADGAMCDLLCSLPIFSVHGIRLLAVFSSTATEDADALVPRFSRQKLVDFCREKKPSILLLATPISQEELQDCIDAGIMGIWNLCETELSPRKDVTVFQAHPLDSLMQLCCTLTQAQKANASADPIIKKEGSLS